MKLPITPAAVIFDLDGSLLDTEPLYTQAAQKILDPFGHTYDLELKRRVMGGDAVRSAQVTIDEYRLPLSPQEFLAAREDYLKDLFPDAEEIEGAGAYLQYLAEKRLPIGLATSSNARLCELKIGKRHWKPLLQTIVCGDDAALKKGKPEPDIFLLCASRMGADPARTVAFEDSRNGIAAAKRAGMAVVAIESPYTTPDDLREADMAISDFCALMD